MDVRVGDVLQMKKITPAAARKCMLSDQVWISN